MKNKVKVKIRQNWEWLKERSVEDFLNFVRIYENEYKYQKVKQR